MSDIILYCPICRSEYREGFSTCSECNVALVTRLDSAEQEEEGDALVPLARESSFEYIAELLDRLEKEEVPYVIEAGTALRLLDIETAEVEKPEPWEGRVYVVATHERKAHKILAELSAEWQSERGNPTVSSS